MQLNTIFSVLIGAAVLSETAGIIRWSPSLQALHQLKLDTSSFSRHRDHKQFDGRNDGNVGNGGSGQNGAGEGSNGSSNVLCLQLIQADSQQNGNNPGSDEQASSATDDTMGNIPAYDKMISSVFTNPKDGDNIAADTPFTISIQIQNLAAGSFVNATSNYYTAPQEVDANGNIIGHTHITVQDTGNTLNAETTLDPTRFRYFKSINNSGNGQGLLSAEVEGLPAGNYRLCSMSAASNHQPVLMPVVQRGSQDDCVRFTASQGGDQGAGHSNDGTNAAVDPQADPNQGQGGGFDGSFGGDEGDGTNNSALTGDDDTVNGGFDGDVNDKLRG